MLELLITIIIIGIVYGLVAAHEYDKRVAAEQAAFVPPKLRPLTQAERQWIEDNLSEDLWSRGLYRHYKIKEFDIGYCWIGVSGTKEATVVALSTNPDKVGSAIVTIPVEVETIRTEKGNVSYFDKKVPDREWKKVRRAGLEMYVRRNEWYDGKTSGYSYNDPWRKLETMQ